MQVKNKNTPVHKQNILWNDCAKSLDKIMLGLANYVLFAINRKKMEKAMYWNSHVSVYCLFKVNRAYPVYNKLVQNFKHTCTWMYVSWKPSFAMKDTKCLSADLDVGYFV